MSSVDFAQMGIEWAAYDSMFDRITGLPNGWALFIDRLEVALGAQPSHPDVRGGLRARPTPACSATSSSARSWRTSAAQLRPDDTLARIGPHRLAILCTDIRHDDEAAQLVRRILHDSGVICTLGIALKPTAGYERRAPRTRHRGRDRGGC